MYDAAGSGAKKNTGPAEENERRMIHMTTKPAAQTVTAALVAALTLAAATPAIAFASPLRESPAIQAQSYGTSPDADRCVSFDVACRAAIELCPIGPDEVASTDWFYDSSIDDYVVTVTARSGQWWVVWVNAATGEAYAIECG